MTTKSMKLFGLAIGLLLAVDLHAQCDESTVSLADVKQQLAEVFSNNMGAMTMGFQTNYTLEFEGCTATVTNQANSKNKQGVPTVYSFDLQDLEGKDYKFYSAKKDSQLTIKIGKDINDSGKVQYVTFEGVSDSQLATTLPKLISDAQCLCANVGN